MDNKNQKLFGNVEVGRAAAEEQVHHKLGRVRDAIKAVDPSTLTAAETARLSEARRVLAGVIEDDNRRRKALVH